jgi:hypothetical protein
VSSGEATLADSYRRVHMTHHDLLTHIYAHYSTLRTEWSHAIDTHENIGAFAFLPEGYSGVDTLDQVKYEFWPWPTMRAYLIKGGETDAGLIDLIQDFDFGEEFLVMIIEYAEGVEKHAVHVHRVNRVGLN